MESLFSLRPRRKKHAFLWLFLFVLIFVGIRLEKTVDNYDGALPISVAIEQLTEEEAQAVRVVAVSPKDFNLTLKRQSDKSPKPTWELEFQFWARCLRVYAPPSVFERNLPVAITIAGTQIFQTDTRAMKATWKPVGSALESPPSISAPHLPFFSQVINGPSDTPFLAIGLQAAALLFIGFPALFILLQKVRPKTKLTGWLRICLTERAALPTSPTETRRYALLGLLILLGTLALLVRGQRYGFVHDDNITQFFPIILQGCKGLEQGVFPTYNPYALMGSPTASMGTYALTYPPTYLSYAVAKYLVRDIYTTLDIFVIVHLALGYLATFALACRIGLRGSLALCAALSFILCGYFCVYTRGWFYMAPVALWTPLILLALLRLCDATRPLNLRWVVECGLAIGLYFHAGNAQMWSYTLLLGAALVGLWQYGGRLPKGRLLWLLPALLLGLAIAAPLLVAQSAEVAGIERSADFKQGTLKGFAALLLPAPLVDAWHPGIHPGIENLWAHLYHFAPLYFCGPVFLGLGLLALASLAVLRWGRRLTGDNAWLLCGGLALLLSFGEDGGLASALAHLPVFNKFQHWWKFLPFVALFFALGGGLVVERWLQSTKKTTKSLKTERTLVVLIPLLLTYNAWLSKPVMWIADKPYPTLPAELKSLLFNPNERLQRGLTLSPWKRDHKGFVFSMAQNFATVYELPMLMGYDPLVEASPLNQALERRYIASSSLTRGSESFQPGLPPEAIESLRHYGVRWICVTDGVQDVGKLELLQALSGNVTLRYTRLGLQIYELADSDPLAFPESSPARSLPILLDAAGCRVSLGGTVSGPVIVNWLARERLHAFVDGKPAPLQRDTLDRIRVEVPPGAQTLLIRYEPDWGKGLALAGGLFALAAIVFLSLRSQPLL